MAISVKKMKKMLRKISPATNPNNKAKRSGSVKEPRTKESQGKGWTNIIKVAKRTIAERPDDHLTSILAELREVNISRKDPGRYYRVRNIVAPLGESVLKSGSKNVEDDFYYPNVTNSKYSLGHVSQIRYLSRFIRPDTTAIMELGSGWSCNVFQLYLAWGVTRSKKLIYYGGEYTPEGRVCSKLLANHDPDIRYRSFTFDYREPDITFLKRQRGHILLFTSHSIEQVDHINPVLFEQLKAIPNDVTVIHFEPVGWQRDAKLMKMRQDNNQAFFQKLGERALDGSLKSVSENSAWWSWRLQYNMNLMPLLKDLEQAGSIKMNRIEYDFNAIGNVLNPSTLIHYDFIR